jgi:hypothetical protein
MNYGACDNTMSTRRGDNMEGTFMDLRREETQKTTGEPEVTGVTGMLLISLCLLHSFDSFAAFALVAPLCSTSTSTTSPSQSITS